MRNVLLLLFLTFQISAQTERTEPPFWFAGMNNSELQIMFYGSRISDYETSVSNDVLIKNIVRTENPNYQFVTIDTKDVGPTELIFTFKKGKKAFTRKYELKQRRPKSALRDSFDSSDVIYLLMPDRFANGDPSNDSSEKMLEKADRNNPDGRHGGDIAGIINNLDYIKSTGATALWATPLCADNDPRGSYHGYGQSDVYNIDPRYGSNDEYLGLSSELHKRDMKLIMDYVTNHWGNHWTFKDMPAYDWLHQFPGYKQTNHRTTTQFDPNASKSDKELCTNGWFVKSMPDLNQSNPLMLNYLIQNAIWWIEYADLDGFRVDTYSYNDKDAIAKWTKAITDEYPNFNIAGEVWMHDQAQIAYWQKDSRIAEIQHYNSNLPTVMDFTLHDADEKAFSEDKDEWDKGMVRIYENFANDFLYPDINNILVFLENHDTNRFNEAHDDFKKYQMGIALVATIRGIPQIYYGSELGMRGAKSSGDADIRRDFPGGWNADPANAFVASGRNENQRRYFDFTSKVLNWRKTKRVIHTGKTTHYVPIENVYVYFRHDETDVVMVIINNSADTRTVETKRFAENIKHFNTGTDIISGKEFSLSPGSVIPLAGKSAMILELR